MYGFQILLDGYWVWVAPVNGIPYKYPTEAQAYDMLYTCYPDQIRAERLGGKTTVRVHKYPEE